MEENRQEMIEKIKKECDQSLIEIIVSNPRSKDAVKKIKVRPILLKGSLYFQESRYTEKQVFHANFTNEEAEEHIKVWLDEFRQIEILTEQKRMTILISKKGKVTVKKKKQSCCQKQSLDHNRKKEYILEEGMNIPFLKDLGVMTQDGKIVRTKYDKFRQINRYLEFIRDVVPKLPTDREITIVDFGCGKSYLTFAMYYYLVELCHLSVKMIGLDLKTEVIAWCNECKQKYGYDNLEFIAGNIESYTGSSKVDMVVTLHACDTATDYALDQAVRWGAEVVLSVPCCQHEINHQISNELLAPIMDYGLLKERFSALLTDGIRAKMLESKGYETQILEFIDMEHTPKNILIRAIKKNETKEKEKEQVKKCCDAFHIEPTIQRLWKGGCEH